jgi:hypothetical protein
MVVMAVAALTLVGTLLSLGGVLCAAVAFVKTWQEHGEEPLYPQIARRMRTLRGWVRRVLLRQQPQVVAVTGIGTLGMTGSARGVVSAPPIPDDAELAEKVALLVRHVRHLQAQAETDRQRHDDEVRAIRATLDTVSGRFHDATLAVESKVKSMVLDTIRLQLVGLFLVGVGTILLAVAGLVAS